MQDFEELLADLDRRLSICIGARSSSPALAHTPIPHTFHRARHAWRTGKRPTAVLEYLWLQNLAEDCEAISTFRGLRNHYRRRLREPNAKDYLGTRAELALAAALTRKGVRFHRPSGSGEPDFILDESFSGALEVTSVQLESSRATGVAYKLSAAVARKAKKAYASPATALFVDQTNLLFLSSADGLSTLFDPEANGTVSAFRSTSFGALLLMTTLQDSTSQELRRVYRRFDSPHLDQSLRAFLDAHYPHGAAVVPHWIAPRMP